MSPILADDIEGGIFALSILAAGGVSSILALTALIPANRGKRPAAIALSTPAILTAVGVTVWIVWQCIKGPAQGEDRGSALNMMFFWFLFAGPSFLTGTIAILVLWAKSTPRS
jgi:hypothetical protein